MELSKNNKIFLGKATFFIVLSIIFCVYVSEVFEKYAKNSTTFSSKSETVEEFKFPIFTICTKEAFKAEILEKYNLSSFQFTGRPPRRNVNVSAENVYMESVFEMGKDFEFQLSFENGGLLIERSQKSDFTIAAGFEVVELATLFYGLCYSIKSNATLKTNGSNAYIELAFTRVNRNISGMIIYISDGDNLGVIAGSWGYRDVPLKQFLGFYNQAEYWTQLKLEERIHLETKSELGIVENIGEFYECKYWNIMKDMKVPKFSLEFKYITGFKLSLF